MGFFVRHGGPRRLGCEPLEPRIVLSHTALITEFMASNDGTLRDQDGDPSDWIEIHNPTSQPINLDGWSLTDDAEELGKWEFPAVTLDAGAFLVVFASDKDRTDLQAELHTNFRISADGEYLTLVQPNGEAVHAFAPQFPPQHVDVSYGLGTLQSESMTLIPAGSTWQYLDNGSNQGTAWREAGFDSSSWSSGPAPLGYGDGDEATVVSYGGNSSDKHITTYFRKTFDVDASEPFSTVTLRLVRDDGAVVYINGQEVARSNLPNTTISASTTALSAVGGGEESTFFEFDVPPGVLVPGENTIAVELHQANSTSSDLSFDLALEGRLPLGEPQHVFFTDPTPGAANGSGFTEFAEPVTFSHAGGIISTPFSLELTAANPGDVIRYTVNGSAPTLASPVYQGPITINRTTMVRAGVFGEGVYTPVTSETFVMIDSNVASFNSNLPLVVINSFGRGFNDTVYTPIHAMAFDTAEDGRASLSGAIDFAGRGGLRWRGSSSLGFAKKNFAFETWDEANEDANHSILGLPAESDWVLHGPYSDKSLMRNHLAYLWSNEIGRYAPRTIFVELFINDDGGNVSSSDYEGVYVFMEKIKRDDDRVDIERLDPTHNSEPEITGGYILKKDRLDPGDSGFLTQRGQRLAYVEPKEEEITPQQAAYIRNYLNAFESALYGANFRDPENGYRQYIDVGSFIDHHILVETMKNIDGFRLSTFMYKDRGGKLHMGPIWDYNLSLGNANYLQGGNPSGWYYPQLSSSDYPWYGRLFQDPDFRQEYIDRWYELRATVFDTTEMMADIDATAELLEEAADRNFDRWRILGQYIWPNHYVAPTWPQEIDFMKDWLTDRLAWIDSQFTGPPTLNHNGGEVEPGFELTIEDPFSQQGGTIYYTLDGSDPRLPGGGVSPTAQEYDGPLQLTQGATVKSRALRFSQWSALAEADFLVNPASADNLAITEIYYHPTPPTPAELAVNPDFNDEDFELLELMNTTSEVVELSGVRFTQGIAFDFTDSDVTSLAPGQIVLLVKNRQAFEARFGTGFLIAGEYGGQLSNTGEQLVLVDHLGEAMYDFEYSDEAPWPEAADGSGDSLTRAALDNPIGEGASWQAAAPSPGVADFNGGELLAGDYNGNGLVEQGDLDLVLAHWGQSASQLPSNWINDPPEGIIDQAELDRVLANWGRSTPDVVVDTPAPAQLTTASLRATVVRAKAADPERIEPEVVKRSAVRTTALDAVLAVRSKALERL